MSGGGGEGPIQPQPQVITIRDGGSIPLQCPVLSQTNYTIWSLRLKVIFGVHGFWEVVELEEGVVIDNKKNNQAIAYLYQAMPEDLVL